MTTPRCTTSQRPVWRAPWMQHRHGVRQLAHQQPRAAGVIQVHVRQQQEVHRLARHAELRQRGQQEGNREVGSDVNECGTSRIDDDVGGGMTRVEVLGVHRADAVRVTIECRPRGNIERL